jgi:hypothetical protein
MQTREFWVRRQQFREIQAVTLDALPLTEGEIRVAIDKVALTANNISYAVSGDSIGYWKYFPAQDGWGKIPAWGFAEVVESRCADVSVGERIWGFFPLASHLTLQPGNVTAGDFIDFAAHRKDLPALYNKYQRTAAEPAMLQGMEDARCLFFPLFATSWIVYDYLVDNTMFGAEQVLIGSASSKTGYGLARMLHGDRTVAQKVVGLTSAGNAAFVQSLACCDAVVPYDQISSLDPSVKTAFVDMSGNSEILAAVHRHFGDNIVASCKVGATHWESVDLLDPVNSPQEQNLPGAKPRFFFAPAHFAKREREWGPGSVLFKAFGAAMQVVAAIGSKVDIQHIAGDEAIMAHYRALLDNALGANTGLMLDLQPPPSRAQA